MFFCSFRSLTLTASLLLTPAASLAEGLQLLMFEREGCVYCQRWNEQIGPAYPKTPEGQAAPLQRIDVKDPLPADVTLTGPHPFLTPTFVLTDDGTEVGRLEGYPGDEFFWYLLDGLLQKTGWTPAGDPAQSADGNVTPSEAAATSTGTPTIEGKTP